WSRQLESLNEVANALASETDVDRLLDLVARRLGELLEARIVTVVLPAGPGLLRFAAAAGEGGDELIGQTMARDGSKSGRVLNRGRSERADSVLDDPDVDPEVTRLLAAKTGLWVPLVVRGEAIGVLAVHDKVGPDARFTDNDLRLAETFASRAAVAVDLSERIAQDALRHVVGAQELERRRLARELHDETGQALTSILLGLKSLEETLESDESRAATAGVRELVVATLQDVRRLAVELRPSVLDDFGLVAALEHLTSSFAEQTGLAVDFGAALGEDRLPEEVETIGEAGSARDAVFEARSLKPDVVLLDVAMPGQSGIEIIPQLLHEHEEARVLMLSMQDEPRYVREAFEAGASGYVLKEAADAELVAAIREVAQGGRYVHPELGARLVAAESAERKRAEEDPLSDREREVLRLLALGHTNQEIAKTLYISVRTAETHRAHIMQKLRLSSRAELVRYALGEGLLEGS